MSKTSRVKPSVSPVSAVMLAATGLLAAGCVSSPTYGTDKTATAQLFDDVSNMASLKPPRNNSIDYEPRPDLVKPAARGGALPPPQDSVASASNPDWPESPEQRRARLRAEADANTDNPNYHSPIIPDGGDPDAPHVQATARTIDAMDHPARITPGEAAQNRKVFLARKAAENGTPTNRKYLSEPPLTYRAPAATAPADQLGEDEKTKEARAKKAALKPGSWKRWVPWN